MDDLLEMTTPIEYVLRNGTSCSIRFVTDYSMTFMNHTGCTEYFKIEKYIQRQFVCYKVTPTIPVKNNTLKPLLMTEYLLAPVETGTIYSLYLNATAFNTTKTITAFVHGYDTSHFEDSVVISVHPVSIIGSQGSSATVTFEENVVHRLEAPYTSKCTRRPDRVSVLQTFVDILNQETVRLLNKSCSFTQLYSGNHSLMTDSDFKVEKFKTTFRQIRDKYDPYSLGWTCDVKWYQSRVSVQSYQLAEKNKDSKHKLVIHVIWPQSHSIKISEEPLQTIIDYLIYIGSSLGFWFGFSVISIVNVEKIMKIFLHGGKSKKERGRRNEKENKRNANDQKTIDSDKKILEHEKNIQRLIAEGRRTNSKLDMVIKRMAERAEL